MTSLLGIHNYGNAQESDIVKYSFQTFLDWGFVNAGAYTNINLSNSDINSQNKSSLRLVSDPNFTTGRVWETFHRNLVWESGVNQTTQPIQISGVYVNNTFYPKSTSGTYAYYIDYPNGKVVFNNALPTTTSVKMEYSYKNVYVMDATKNNFLREVQYNSFNVNSVGYNTPSSGNWSQIGDTRIQPIFVGLDVITRSTSPYELGTNAKWVNSEIIAHIVGENKQEVNKIESILVFQKGKVFPGLNLDLIAQSGAFPLNYKGEINPGAKTYVDLSKDPTDGGYRNRQAYVLDAYNSNDQMISTSLYYKVVRLQIQTIKPDV